MHNNPTITDFYEWGPWVNGGAWIHNNNCKIDFLYRSIDQIKETIKSAKNGKYITDFEQQPPYGFISIIYLGEIEMGCMTRIVKNFVDALYAINERYLIGYKLAIERLEKLEKVPCNLKNKVEKILLCNGDMAESIESARKLFAEIKELAGESYKPKYRL